MLWLSVVLIALVSNLDNLAAGVAYGMRGTRHSIKQIKFPAILLPCTPIPGAQTPCYVAADPSAEHRAFRQFMTPSRTQPSRPAGAPRGAGSRAVRSAAVTGDVSDGKAQATALARAGMPAISRG